MATSDRDAVTKCNCNEGFVCETHPDKPEGHDGCDAPGHQCPNPVCPWWQWPSPAALRSRWREDVPPITLLETCWKLRSPRGRVLTCGVFRTIAGLEVRCSYAQDDLIRSQYAPAIETARAIAMGGRPPQNAKALHRNRVFAPMPRWSKRTRLQAAQFEWEQEAQFREVRLSSTSVNVGDPVRVAVAGVEVEGRIEAVESSTLHVRIGRRLL